MKIYHMLVWYYCMIWSYIICLYDTTVRCEEIHIHWWDWLFPSRQVTYSFQTDLCVLQVVEARLWVLIVHPSSWGIAMNFLESRSFLGLAGFITAERERPWSFLSSLARLACPGCPMWRWREVLVSINSNLHFCFPAYKKDTFLYNLQFMGCGLLIIHAMGVWSSFLSLAWYPVYCKSFLIQEFLRVMIHYYSKSG